MLRTKAEKRARRKLVKALPCPFCGQIPQFEFRCDSKHSSHGSWGHYAIRHSCCRTTRMGQTELFFCNNYKKPNYRLWWQMFCGLVDDWNQRTEPSPRRGTL